LKTAQKVNEIVKSVPTVCEDCGVLLLGEDPQPERHQVSELPKTKAIIVEYQRHTWIAWFAVNQTGPNGP